MTEWTLIESDDSLPDSEYKYYWIVYDGKRVDKACLIGDKWWTDRSMTIRFTGVTHYAPLVPPEPPAPDTPENVLVELRASLTAEIKWFDGVSRKDVLHRGCVLGLEQAIALVDKAQKKEQPK